MLRPLVDLEGQGPGSRWLAHVADVEALELESLLLLMCSLPRTVRSCHSGGTTRSREAGIKSSGRKRLPRL